jgi:hypothetical protein
MHKIERRLLEHKYGNLVLAVWQQLGEDLEEMIEQMDIILDRGMEYSNIDMKYEFTVNKFYEYNEDDIEEYIRKEQLFVSELREQKIKLIWNIFSLILMNIIKPIVIEELEKDLCYGEYYNN